MSEQLKVISEPEQKKQITANGQPLIVWSLNLQRGEEKLSAELLKRPGNAPPGVGSVVLGDLTQNDYGWRLKLANESGGIGPRGRSAADTKAIQRQHSQEMALRLIDLGLRHGIFEAEKDGVPVDIWQHVRAATDWFERDIGHSLVHVGGSDAG